MNLQENPKKEAFITHASSFISPGWVAVPSVWLMLPLNNLLPHLLPCFSQVSHAASPEKLDSWSSFEMMRQSFSLFPQYHSYYSQFKEWTQINSLCCWNQANLMGCSVLSFMIKSFSNSGFLGCHYNKKKSNFSKRGAERQNPVMLSLILVFTQKHRNVMAAS